MNKLALAARFGGAAGAGPSPCHGRWPRAAPARLYRLVLEQSVGGASYYGVAEEGIPLRELMTDIGRQLNLPVASKPPEEAAEYLGPIARFVAMDGPASSALTRQQLCWHPNQPGLLADLEQGHYFGR